MVVDELVGSLTAQAQEAFRASTLREATVMETPPPMVVRAAVGAAQDCYDVQRG